MSLIKYIRIFLGRFISFFCISAAKRRFIRKFFEEYDLREAKRCKSFKHQIISLGFNCSARTVTTLYGLKARKIYGEKTIITDQTFFGNIKELVFLWNTHFEDYFDGLYFNKDINAWYVPKYNSFSPHEYKLSKEQFIKTLKKRINNFYEMINTDKYAIFLRIDEAELTPEDVKLLSDKIKETRKGKPYKLILVNLNNKHIDLELENTIIINNPYKLSAKWQLELDTPEGKKFCDSFINPINRIIEEL